MMKENTMYMYINVQIFYFHSVYLVLGLRKTDIHVKQVFKLGRWTWWLFNFFNQIIFLFLHVWPTCESSIPLKKYFRLF